MPKITREEMLRNEVACEVVWRQLPAYYKTGGQAWIEEAASFDNRRWPGVLSEIRNLMDSGLEHADCIDSVDLTECGRLVVQAIYDYIAEAKASEIEDEIAARSSAEAREDADYRADLLKSAQEDYK